MTDREQKYKPMVHRTALLVVLLIWPLIWVGGLVTTYDAGMSVPDWPNTYGYNLLLYPYKTWLLGPFDLFIEHGHRLLGILVGLAAIGFVVASFWSEQRRWVKGLSIVTLLLVIVQGGLGGVRVLLSDRVFAMIHGSTAPVVFATAVGAAVVTGRWWQRNQGADETGSADPAVSEGGSLMPKGTLFLVFFLTLICYAQLVLGAKIRHLQPNDSPVWFLYTVWAHVVVALMIWILAFVAWYRLRKISDLALRRPGVILVGLTAIQITLGVVTWVVNYGWPSFLQWLPGTNGHLIVSKDFVDAMLVTGHVATGPLILAAAVVVGLRLLRLQFLSRHSVS
ncbi:Heme A synthase [Novipirellula aureliae]|uniref:Heme A synthase n=1 Tax=Novipirellula aureliae TaxID=2527966 RepID=A0A5C6E8B7_9BACT|nr:COX15/CtaA family protein [Novipirellula aureliae]TWU45913.1 Heme A synthase [Novipirellula aureliae]